MDLEFACPICLLVAEREAEGASCCDQSWCCGQEEGDGLHFRGVFDSWCLLMDEVKGGVYINKRERERERKLRD